MEEVGRDAIAEQNAAALVTIGRMHATYYASLVGAGMPSTTAERLARDYAWLSWHRTLYPEQTPRVMPHGD